MPRSVANLSPPCKNNRSLSKASQKTELPPSKKPCVFTPQAKKTHKKTPNKILTVLLTKGIQGGGGVVHVERSKQFCLLLVCPSGTNLSCSLLFLGVGNETSGCHPAWCQ